MKTAISLPDAVFRAAERQAKRTRKSRSQLYAEALAEYLSRHAPEEVTEAMNQVVDQLDEERDPFVVWLKVDPTLENLRSDPRFHAILQHMVLADKAATTIGR